MGQRLLSLPTHAGTSHHEAVSLQQDLETLIMLKLASVILNGLLQ